MLKLIKYIFKREYKPLLGALSIYVLSELLFILHIIPKEFIGIDIYGQIRFLAMLIPAVLVVERTGWYIEKGMLFENKEHFMLIPHSIDQMVSAVLIVNAFEIGIIAFVISLFTFKSVLDISLAVLFTVIGLMTLQALGMWGLAVIAKKTDKRVNANIMLAVIMMTALGVFAFIVLFLVDNGIKIPFMDDPIIAFIAMAIILFGLGFKGVCTSIGKGIEDLSKVRRIFAGIIILAMVTYGVGQWLSYEGYINSKSDEVINAIDSIEIEE